MPARRSYSVAPALLAVLVFAACIPGGGPPSVAPRGTLQPEGQGPGGRGDRGPFGVASAVPQGQTDHASEISLTFSRPIRPLDGSTPPPPIRIQPAVAGSWDWVGTRALRFSPEKPLPAATEFEVEVPTSVKAMDGSTLKEAYRFKFSTPRPRLVSWSPRHSGEGLLPDATVHLGFNQPVDEAAVLSGVTISGGKQTIPFQVRRPEPSDPRSVELVPRAPLPIHTEFKVKISETLRGAEGPLTMGQAREFSFSTYGPLEASFNCSTDGLDRCRPGGWMSVKLSNPVPRKDLKKVIQIDPPVKLQWPSWQDDKGATDALSLDGAFLPDRTYTVRVKAQTGKGPLKDVHGQPLGKDFVARVKIGDLPSAFNIGIQGEYLEPSQLGEVPLFAMNLDRVEATAVPLDLETLLRTWGHPANMDVEKMLQGSKTRRVTLRGSKNRVARQGLRLDEVQKRGPVVVVAQRDGKKGDTQGRVVQLTDLAISAKVAPQESLVWVTRLSTGKPVEGARVEVYKHGTDKPAGVVKTDAAGIAKMPSGLFVRAVGEDEHGDLIVVRDGDDWAYHRTIDSLDPWRYGASSEGGDRPPALGLLFTERGLYRPGDVVKLKGVARQGSTKGMTTPAGQKAHVTVTGPDGEKLTEFEATLSSFGTFSHEVSVPPGSKLGRYDVTAELGEKKTSRGHDDEEDSGGSWATSFSVAEYRAAEFKVSTETDRASYLRGDELTCTGRGSYLFGAPMAGSEGRASVTRREAHFQPPGLEGFTVSDWAYASAHQDRSLRGGEVQSGEAKLDDKGSMATRVKLDLPGQHGTEAVTCEVEVTDLSRQTFSSTTTALVHPGEVYAALRASRDLFVDAGATLRPEVVAAQPDGKRRAGLPAVIELFERTYAIARQAAGEAGYHTSTTITDKPVGKCSVVSGAQGCELRVPQAGHYVVRATITDTRGNKVSSSEHIYALGSSGGGWGDNDQQQLKLVSDKKGYKVGDTAKILIQSPFAETEALVTVEREGVLWQKTMHLAGPTPTVEVPVTDAFLPNAFVSVLLVRGRTKAAPKDGKATDVGAPTFRMGYAPIVVDHSHRRLKVDVKPAKKELHPGDELAVELDVRDSKGQGARAEVALYAVDEGVLSLVGYRTPDPVETFFAPRGTQVRTLDARDSLARLQRDSGVALGLDKGLDGGGGGDAPRRDFRQTAYFNPAIVTDDGGKARVSFKLPEGLTTYRLMAVATAADDRFGSADAQVLTSKPIMVRPALPRVLRAGDRFEASAIVTSKGLAGRFEVSLLADGLAVPGETRKSIDLALGQSQEVQFSASAPRAGKAKLRFDVKGEGGTDSVEVNRDVITPTVLESTALYGDTTSASGERLGDMTALRDDVGGLEISLSSTALAGLMGGVEQLVEYPYGCTEQLTSRLVPLLPLRDLVETFGLKLPDKVDEAVRTTVGKVLNNQRGDGSFGLWPESSDGYPWLTAYALWGLGEAKKRNIHVRDSAIQAATRYLRQSLTLPTKHPYQLAERAFVLDVLAENGDPDAGAMAALFEQREKLPTFARAQLLHALATSKADRSLIDPLVRDIESGLRIDGPNARVADSGSDDYAYLLESTTRSTALALRALVAANPAHPSASRLALGLLSDRRGGRWRTTHETAWALLALDAYRRAQEAEEPQFDARVFLGQTLLAEAPFHGRSHLAAQNTIPMASISKSSNEVLAFDKKGSGKLFYEARLRFARKQPLWHPVDSGFFLDKATRVLTPEALREGIQGHARGMLETVRAGDLVVVDLTVVAPSERTFVVLDDPLPAGLEAIDSSLLGAASWARQNDTVSDDDDGPRRWNAYTPLTRKELRDDRVVFFIDRMPAGVHRYRYLARATTLGTFISPPARVEEMYVPETFGQTAGAPLTVAPK